MLKHRNLGLLGLGLAAAFIVPRPGQAQTPAQASIEGPQGAPDSAVYALAPASVLLVHAGKSGLLSGFGHEHQIRAHKFSGTVVYFAGDVGRSRVTVTVLTDSLRVVPEADSADIPKITETMRAKTLRVDSFPEIVFVSRAVVPLPAPPSPGTGERGAVPSSMRVTGDLRMVGRTRPVSVDLTLEVTVDTLRAEGSFAVKQTDFGINPYSTALGMVKVKNEVRFELHVVAVAYMAPSPPAPTPAWSARAPRPPAARDHAP